MASAANASSGYSFPANLRLASFQSEPDDVRNVLAVVLPNLAGENNMSIEQLGKVLQQSMQGSPVPLPECAVEKMLLLKSVIQALGMYKASS